MVLGGDFPLGDETPRRKTLAVRQKGLEARFLTVIEPYEKECMVEKVEASDADHLTVWLKDRRKQHIVITGLDGDGNSVKIDLIE